MIIFAKICISDDYRGFILLFVHPALVFILLLILMKSNIKLTHNGVKKGDHYDVTLVL